MTEKAAATEKAELQKEESSFVIDKEFEDMVKDIAPTTDDPTLPSFTLRVWILGTLFCVIFSYINKILAFRTNAFAISPFVGTLLAYPLGQIMAKVIPSIKFNVPFIGEVDTNPGPFNVKEHVLIYIFSSTGSSAIYALYNVIVQEVFYELYLGTFWDLAFLFCSGAMGFGLSGILRKFLIRPSHMIWPTVLPSVAMFSALHHVETKSNEDDGKKHWSQLRMFGFGAIVMGIWTFIGPGFMSNMLNYLPLMCWIAPKSNTLLQSLGSPQSGVGMFALTTDWTSIGAGAMSIPFWAAVNNFANVVIIAWILVPIAWRGDWFTQPKYPTGLNTNGLIDAKGKGLKANSVVNLKTKTLDEKLYKARAPVHFTTFFAAAYFGHFAALTAAVVHTGLWYGKDIVARFSNAKSDHDDIHCKLIDAYPEVPDTWYYGFFLFTVVLMVAVGLWSGMDLPWWASLFAIVLSFVGTAPIAVVLATAGVSLYMNVISQFLIGLIIEDKPIINMAFKCLGVSVSLQCVTLLTDLKLGHYLKVPPRNIFIAQIASLVVSLFVTYVGMRVYLSDAEHVEWIQKNGKGVSAQGQVWGGTSYNTFFSASLIWGAIGPRRFFFETQYAPLIWGGVLAGATLPIIIKGCHVLFGGEFWRLIHPALILAPTGPGANQAYMFTSFVVSTISQFYLYRYHTAWWKRYNYVLATAFDVGAGLVTFILVAFMGHVEFPAWFLNTDGTTPEIHGPNGDWCFTDWGKF